jgi:hypothetical protein
MSPNVAALPPEASRMDAIRLMQERNVRRVPLIDGERIAGIVKLDDLVLDETVPMDELAAVVRSQFEQGAPAAFGCRRVREARAEGTYWRLINELRANAGLEATAQAEIALEVGLTSLLRRLTPDEAKDLIAQLASLHIRRCSACQPARTEASHGPRSRSTWRSGSTSTRRAPRRS